MELHTLGVDGGYTQADVTTLARILTGWGLDRGNLRRGTGNAFRFDASRHDFGPKVFLGHPLPSSGEMEGVEALDLLARSPVTAHHVVFELAQYFVADTPPADLVDRLAERFHDSGGDIRAVLQTLFASREFRDGAAPKYKTPYQFVLSAVRATGLTVRNPRPLLAEMARLGMPLYGCRTPDGYKNTEAAWLNPDATVLRIGFATAFAHGNLPIGYPPPATAAAPLLAAPAPAPVAAGEPLDPVRLEEVAKLEPRRPYPRGGRGGSDRDARGNDPRRPGFHATLGRTMKRRDFLRLSAGTALLPLGGGAWAATAAGGPGRLVVILLRGAVDGLNVVVPCSERAYYEARPTIAIGRPGTTDGALPLDGRFGMHPSLAALLPLWGNNKLAFIHAAGSPDPTRSHFDAQLFIENGTPGRAATPNGWMNRLLAALPSPHGPTEAVSIGPTLPQI